MEDFKPSTILESEDVLEDAVDGSLRSVMDERK